MDRRPKIAAAWQAAAYWRLGMIYEHKDEKEMACTSYRKSLELNPDLKQARKALKKLKCKKGWVAKNALIAWECNSLFIHCARDFLARKTVGVNPLQAWGRTNAATGRQIHRQQFSLNFAQQVKFKLF